MIAKHILIKQVQKGCFSRLINYLTHTQKDKERVGRVNITNCYSNITEAAVIEILNTQQMNQRAVSDKNYHLMVSFNQGERPEDSILEDIEKILCEGLGFGDHQRISVTHLDTEHFHMHIAINKIHPVKHTLHDPIRDFKTLARLCEGLEQQYGLAITNHTTHHRGAQNKASDLEHKAQLESLVSWIRRNLLTQLQEADSWEGLHAVLTNHGLVIQERGNGFVVATQDGLAVKASSVDRALSKKYLTERLGRWVPADKNLPQSSAKQYQKRPVESSASTLYTIYLNEQQSLRALRLEELGWAKTGRARLHRAAKEQFDFKRKLIQYGWKGLGKRFMYGAISADYNRSQARINLEYQKIREQINQKYQRTNWVRWLEMKAREGDIEAMRILKTRKRPTKQLNDKDKKVHKKVHKIGRARI
ncbi:TraI/MobA(P) family conjugative relaxase [Nitrosomonas sp. Is37]|uniref:TraI/MobA(P) family conjugative relaxase n=1 Tax=Nitrosomonas sp. Is37 TaxID=3080535 RepID=UPI00294B250B|nr:TraI/MobA(P) family conjugative relaxase [Nitrosomonas sp. Is37]MDV6344756.1 TraI/MobA(P) family conjugative relaxase [Nitrosomonas sp. Is37]